MSRQTKQNIQFAVAVHSFILTAIAIATFWPLPEVTIGAATAKFFITLVSSAAAAIIASIATWLVLQ